MRSGAGEKETKKEREGGQEEVKRQEKLKWRKVFKVHIRSSFSFQ